MCLSPAHDTTGGGAPQTIADGNAQSISARERSHEDDVTPARVGFAQRSIEPGRDLSGVRFVAQSNDLCGPWLDPFNVFSERQHDDTLALIDGMPGVALHQRKRGRAAAL